MFKKIVMFLTLLFMLTWAPTIFAHQPIIVSDSPIQITNPEISQAFYDELNGIPKRYFVESSQNFELYINLLVPLKANANGRYSAKIYDLNNDLKLLATIDGPSVPWSTYYETFAKDYYFKGPEFDQPMPAGKYAIDVYSGDNQGKYVLAIGKIETFSVKNSFNIIGILRNLKVNFFNTSPFKLTLTIFGIIYLVSIFIIATFTTLVYKFVIHKTKKTFLISSKNQLINSSISIVLIILGLYTWSPIILFLADIFVIHIYYQFINNFVSNNKNHKTIN